MMNEDTRKDIEDFIQHYFSDNTIIVNEYSKTEIGLHIGLYYQYTFNYFNHDFLDHLSFHLNVFNENDDWDFKPQFEQTYMITDIMNPVQHKNGEVKQRNLPFLVRKIMNNRVAIKQKMIGFYEDIE